MSFSAFSSAYKKAIESKIVNLEHDIGRGMAESHEAYKDMCGFRNGLDDALRIFQDTIRKYAELDDDED